MIVPPHRESDWIFSTQSGHLQLLLSSPHFSRLILIANHHENPSPNPNFYVRPLPLSPDSTAKLEQTLIPLLIALSPKSTLHKGLPPFLIYEDEIVRSVIVEICIGSCVGEMLVEDVQLGDSEFRRRLRFKRMPNLVQTQMRIVPNFIPNSSVNFGDLGYFRPPETGVLVHPYLTPMVASLSLISACRQDKIRNGFRPKALCLGIGGGALPTFLNSHLDFHVVGVESDEVVLRVAKQHFGLKDGEFLQVYVEDGFKLLKQLAENGTDKFDVIMTDLDSTDPTMGSIAPPLDFVTKSVLLAARLVLHEVGIIVVNVIPPTTTSTLYERLIHEFQEVFEELYEIDVGNGENFVLIATVAPIKTVSSENDNSFTAKLNSAAYIDSIRKI